MKNTASWQNKKYYFDPKKQAYAIHPDGVNPRSIYHQTQAINHYARIIRAHASGRLLDLGCGVVPYFDLYRDLVTENYCVDWENTFHQNPFIDQFADLNFPLPLADTQFDTVLLTDVLEHIPRPEPLMREIARVLRPSGKLILTVPFFYWLHEPPYDYYRYTEFALRKFCEEAGLTVVELEPYGGLPDVFFDLINKKWVSNPKTGRLYRGFCQLLNRTGYIRRWRETSKNSFPLGYCLAAEKKKV